MVPWLDLADKYFVKTCLLVVRAENERLMLISDDCIMFCNFTMHPDIVTLGIALFLSLRTKWYHDMCMTIIFQLSFDFNHCLSKPERYGHKKFSSL